MEFGAVPHDSLEVIEYLYPARVFEALPGKEDPSFTVYLCTTRWGAKDWCGVIYPEKTKTASFLDEYVKQLNFVEFNSSFYAIPKVDLVKIWHLKR